MISRRYIQGHAGERVDASVMPWSEEPTRYDRLAQHFRCDRDALIRAITRGLVGELDNLGIVVSSAEVNACWDGDVFRHWQLLEYLCRQYLV